MEPYAASSWLRLQELIEHPEWLASFPRLVEQLQLRPTGPMDQVDTTRREVQWRNDIQDLPGGIIIKGRYMMGRRGHPYQWFRSLDLSFNPKAICISQLEVQRVYGVAKPRMPVAMDATFSSWQERQVRIGYAYSLIYSRDLPSGAYMFSFAFASSGCAVEMKVVQDLNEGWVR